MARTRAQEEGNVQDFGKEFTEWVIPSERFSGLDDEEFAAGAYARLVRVKDMVVGDDCVAKEVLYHGDGSWFPMWSSEVKMLVACQGPGVVKLRGFTVEPPYFIVTDLYTGGTVRGRTVNPEKRPKKDEPEADEPEADQKKESLPFVGLSATDRAAILIGTVRGLVTIHEKSVIHLDIKSGNIFLTEDLLAVIGDFGTAVFEKDAIAHSDVVGTMSWIAPERFDGGPLTDKTDIYAIGILMWVLATERVPWDGRHDMYILGRLSLGCRPPWDDAEPVKQRWRDLAELCWSSDMEKRPTAKQLLAMLKEDLDLLDDVDIDVLRERMAYEK